MPDLLFRLEPRRAARVQGVRGGDRADRVHARQGLRHGHDAADRLLRRAGGGADRAAANLDLATIQQQELANGVPLPHLAIPDAPRRGLEGARDSPRRSTDWAALNARSKFWGDDQRAAFKNWEEVADPRNPLGRRQGVNERIMLRELLRRVDMMVILENRLDALVRLHTPLPPGMIGGAYQHGIASNLRRESLYGPNAGLTEVLIPAGYVTTVYDPVFALSAGRHALRVGGLRHADHHSGAGPAVLAGVPRRAGQGGCAAEDRLGLRSGLAAPRAAAGFRPIADSV